MSNRSNPKHTKFTCLKTLLNIKNVWLVNRSLVPKFGPILKIFVVKKFYSFLGIEN